jgi:arsenite methyltransferase
MLPILKIIFLEKSSRNECKRITEAEVMNELDQVESYVKAYEWGGPTSALQLHHLKELSLMIRMGDTIVDLACGPGPLLLELAALYPECSFIGVDLSPMMLAHLDAKVKSRNLKNVRTLLADIRTLKKSDLDGGADLVISTSAMHHLPEVKDLGTVFETIKVISKNEAGVYIFDFGLLRSEKTRQILVAELRKTAPILTVKDYEVSLRACFPLKTVFSLATELLPKPLWIIRSSFVDFFYFLQSPQRLRRSPEIEKKIKQIWRSLRFDLKIEHVMIRILRKRLRWNQKIE